MRLQRLATFAAAALLPWAAVARACPPGEDEGAATPRWDQYGGNAARTFASSTEPVRAQPRVAWKASGMEHAVAWEGTIYSVVPGSGARSWTLRAHSVADGSSLATSALPKTSSAHVAVARGMVIVATGDGLFGYQLQKAGFTRRWTVKGDHRFPPAILDDTVYSLADHTLSGHDPLTGKVTVEGRELRSHAPPAIVREAGGHAAAGVVVDDYSGYVGRHLFLRRIGTIRHGSEDRFGRLRGDPDEVTGLHLCRIPAATGWGAWLLLSPVPLLGQERNFTGALIADVGDSGLVDLAWPPTVYGENAFGLSADGRLLAMDTEAHFTEIVGRGQLPPGARPGAASRARGTAYFGNWAVDLDSRRVLWCLPEFAAAGAALPLADRVLLVHDAAGTAYCLTDRSAAPPGGSAGEPAPAGAAPAVPSAAAPLPSLPPGDGVLFADGEFVEGTVLALPGPRFRVEPAAGEGREADGSQVLLARAGGEVVHRGRSSEVLARWRRTLHPPALDVLMGLHARAARVGLHEGAAAILADARLFGLPADRAAQEARRARGVKANPVPERSLAALEPEFRAARAKAREPFLAAATWCRERGFPAVAACLLLDGRRLQSGDGVPEGAAATTVPAAFPWSGAADAVPRWLEWAPEIVSADAEFLPPEHPLRRGVAEGPWGVRGSAVVLRSPNIVFRSLSQDPAVVGRCLRNAEFTGGALTALLGAAAVTAVVGDGDRLDVRLHADEASFRAERSADGDAPSWAVGYYSPTEGVSRFYLPADGDGDPLGRGLFETLAHEVTHHFLDRRWRAAVAASTRRGTTSNGYWAIEGIARFVEDQAVEMDRRGLRFDDRTVPSLEATAQAARRGVLFPPAQLLGWPREVFAVLPSEGLLTVRLRNTLSERVLSPIGLFYEQSGAMAYFLVMERGEEGRRAFFAYLAEVYAGTAPAAAWKPLGFPSAAEFDRAFTAFLEGLR